MQKLNQKTPFVIYPDGIGFKSVNIDDFKISKLIRKFKPGVI